MPVIPGADLTSVSTDFQAYPDGEYLMTFLSSEITPDAKQCRIKMRIESPEEFAGRLFTDFINIKQNDGKWNEIGLSQCKRYLETVFGKNSPEAESSPPDTDPLNGHQVRVVLEINEYYPRDEQAKPESERNPENKKRNNKVKRVFPA